jgi:hypothetical protein
MDSNPSRSGDCQMNKSDGGKGSSPRPFSISEEEYARRWEAIFGKDQVDKIIEDAEKYLEETKEKTNER